MAHEPRGLVGHSKHPVELMRADALFARAHEVHGEPPFCQRNVRPLEYGFDRGGELLVAGVAVVQAGPRALALGFRHILASGATVRTDSTIRPPHRFERFAGFVFIGENRIL